MAFLDSVILRIQGVHANGPMVRSGRDFRTAARNSKLLQIRLLLILTRRSGLGWLGSGTVTIVQGQT
jgi:hypothetical protein